LRVLEIKDIFFVNQASCVQCKLSLRIILSKKYRATDARLPFFQPMIFWYPKCVQLFQIDHLRVLEIFFQPMISRYPKWV